ncbi:hypothetical protein TcasGA2_TC014670 [Tribolium castaneum]|uniref:Uncharacterized protein n=1 Tax=Tribolium castaneum TaxID=7070 RepID=D6WNI2_TRICA|nr:hypothetical protein TcasGA2_TC014670 [Tribolium castaneum]
MHFLHFAACGPTSCEIRTRLCPRAAAVTLYPCHSQSAHYKTAVRAPTDVITAMMSSRSIPLALPLRRPCSPHQQLLRHCYAVIVVTSDATTTAGADERRLSLLTSIFDAPKAGTTTGFIYAADAVGFGFYRYERDVPADSKLRGF